MVRTRGQAAKNPGLQVSESFQQPPRPKPWPTYDPGLTDARFDRSNQEGLDAWAQWHYCKNAFKNNGNFRGWRWLKDYLIAINGGENDTLIKETVRNLATDGEFPMMDQQNQPMLKEIRMIMKNTSNLALTSAGATTPCSSPVVGSSAQASTPVARTLASSLNRASSSLGTRDLAHGKLINVYESPTSDLLAYQMNQLQLGTRSIAHRHLAHQDENSNLVDVSQARVSPYSMLGKNHFHSVAKVDFGATDLLLSAKNPVKDEDDHYQSGIRHAPLLDESIIKNRIKTAFLPQYGLIGTHDQSTDNARSELFLNTNIPFSAFVCGVQGSDKSHTTSCILENCLVQSENLGVLQVPLSALVFSYGLFTGDGAGFSISEAAFLGAPDPRVSSAHVKRINVLVCETNFLRIRRLYERLPHVTVTCFKFDPNNLDIDLMLTLMNVDESGRVPLYMTQVLGILRNMATTNASFDYTLFKQHIALEKFSSF